MSEHAQIDLPIRKLLQRRVDGLTDAYRAVSEKLEPITPSWPQYRLHEGGPAHHAQQWLSDYLRNALSVAAQHAEMGWAAEERAGLLKHLRDRLKDAPTYVHAVQEALGRTEMDLAAKQEIEKSLRAVLHEARAFMMNLSRYASQEMERAA